MSQHLCEYINTASDLPQAPLFLVEQSTGASITRTAVEARHRVASLSKAFTQQLGLQRRDRVFLLAHTSPETLEAIFAVLSVGCVAAPINWRWTYQEIAEALKIVEPKAVITDVYCTALVIDALRKDHHGVEHVVSLGETGMQVSRHFAMSKMASPAVNGDSPMITWWSAEDLMLQATCDNSRVLCLFASEEEEEDQAAFLVFTSGTSSAAPKAAVISHHAMHFQCECKLKCCGYNASDVYIHLAPLFHVGGLCSALAMMHAGARHVFLQDEGSGFSPRHVVGAMQRCGATACIAVPTMVSDLVDYAWNLAAGLVSTANSSRRGEASSCEVQTMQKILIGAGAVWSETLESAGGLLFPNATFYGAYGMTEACSSLTYRTLWRRLLQGEWRGPSQGEEREAVYVGTAAPGIRLATIRIDDNDRQNTEFLQRIEQHEVPRVRFCQKGETGEIATCGPHLMLGYWKDDAATRRSSFSTYCDDTGERMTWFRTGDVGIIDAHDRVWLVGRVKDTIKTGGENVHAAEVERVLMEHKAVQGAVVIGMSDARLGERVFAGIVLRKGWLWEGPTVQCLDSRHKEGDGTSVVLSKTERRDSRPSSRNSNLSSRDVNNMECVEKRWAGKELVVGALQLQRHCRAAGLAGFKVPRGFAVFESFPTNATGKIVKAAVRHQIEFCLKGDVHTSHHACLGSGPQQRGEGDHTDGSTSHKLRSRL